MFEKQHLLLRVGLFYFRTQTLS